MEITPRSAPYLGKVTFQGLAPVTTYTSEILAALDCGDEWQDVEFAEYILRSARAKLGAAITSTARGIMADASAAEWKYREALATYHYQRLHEFLPTPETKPQPPNTALARLHHIRDVTTNAGPDVKAAVATISAAELKPRETTTSELLARLESDGLKHIADEIRALLPPQPPEFDAQADPLDGDYTVTAMTGSAGPFYSLAAARDHATNILGDNDSLAIRITDQNGKRHMTYEQLELIAAAGPPQPSEFDALDIFSADDYETAADAISEITLDYEHRPPEPPPSADVIAKWWKASRQIS